MTQSTTAQAWLHGGPADGAVRPVERGRDGRPPALLMFSGGQVFLGSSDTPASETYAVYELQRAPVEAGLWQYLHVGTLTR